MGIKFHCPNGHKLNVKAFLAGKRGICPHCGCKMDIPLESQRGPNARGQAAGKSATSAAPAPAAVAATAPATAPATVPATVPATAAVAVQVEAEPPRETSSAGAVKVAASSVPADAVVAPGDPLAESPQALWYVRPTTGGQFGPASGDSLRGWIDEGRVNGQSLVWREGWPQWKKADGVFKELALPVAAPMVSPPAVATTAPAQAPAAAGSAVPLAATPTAPSVSQADEARPTVRRRKSKLPTIVAVLVMTVLLVLLTVFLWFLTQ